MDCLYIRYFSYHVLLFVWDCVLCDTRSYICNSFSCQCFLLTVWNQFMAFCICQDICVTIACHQKLWIPAKVFPSYSYLEPCHNMRFYKKIFSFFLKAWNFSTRSMQVFCKGGEWLDPSKVNFTECWFQVKIFLKAEMLQLCILFLPAYSPQIFFNIKKKVWIGKHFNDGLGAHGSWEFLTISGGIFLIESFRVLESLGEFIWPLGSPWWGLNGLLSWFCSYGLFYRLTNS